MTPDEPNPAPEGRRPTEPIEPAAATAAPDASEEATEAPDPVGRQAASRGARTLGAIVLLFGVAAALAGVVLVVNQLTQPGGAVTVTVSDPDLLGLPAPDGLPDGTWLELDSVDHVQLHAMRMPVGLRALSEAPILLGGLLWLVGAVFLRRVLSEIAAGRPFAPIVSRRLAGLALVVLAGALLPRALETIATVVVLEHLDLMSPGSPVGFTIFSLDLAPILMVVLLLIVSRVFQHGQHLTEDTEGLV